ncbi:hypothetical protein K440DRAFT_646617 [Wilcoxina mikolae CBS 423.85]|nr:hypothetical protein K440DRAFT_646617 [Wilcoxina mikolae CBS 423.85]
MNGDEQVYFRKQWLTKEQQLVSTYVDRYPNPGCYGTSRTESYHNPVNECLNHHLGLEKTVKFLMQQTDTIVHKIMSEENLSRVRIPMVIASESFKSLSLMVTQYAISLIIPEWQQAKTMVLSNEESPVTAAEARETFETVIPPGSKITFPPHPKTRVRQAKTHGKAKACGMTAAEIATKKSKQRKKRATQKQKRAQKPHGPQKHQQNRDSLDYTEVEQAEDDQEMLDSIVVRKR